MTRICLQHTVIALLVMGVGALVVHYYVLIGAAPRTLAWIWTVCSMGGMLSFFVLIRSGWTRGFADPALTVSQITFAFVFSALAYMLVGAGRGSTFPIVMVTLMFGMFQLRLRQVASLGAVAVVLFGMAMALMAWLQPAVYTPSIEIGHFFMLATMLAAVAVLAGRLETLRQRLQVQKNDLASAVERIQALAITDELTGLPNRRFMQELMTRHQERAARIEREFCLALLDIDHFKLVNDRFGHAMGDTVLTTLTREMKTVMRGSDELGRWGGEEFIMLMPNSNAAEALVGVERLRRRVQAVSMACQGESLSVTVSAGIAQSRPHETIAQILERADQALYAAKAAGRNRTVQADEIPEPAPPQTALSPSSTAPPLQ